jgi:GT2 family glycosyltransferase
LAEFGSVTAVIPHWNRAGFLAPLLKQLSAQTYPIEEVLVCDNGSTDDSQGIAEALGATVVQLGENLGFAAAVNRGIERTRTEWVLILNNDVSMDREWLGTLLGGAVQAGACFATGKLLRASDPGTVDGTFDAVCRGGTAWRCGSGRPDGALWSEPREIDTAPLTAAVFRRNVFEKIGLLDQRFESYLEDVDLGLRCAAAGIKGAYVPQAVALHAGSGTLGVWHKDTVRRMARNQKYLLAKHFDGAPRWPVLVAQLLWGFLAIVHGRGFAFLRGVWEGRTRYSELRAAGSWSASRRCALAGEKDIHELQSKTGFDSYWRIYFALTGGAR